MYFKQGNLQNTLYIILQKTDVSQRFDMSVNSAVYLKDDLERSFVMSPVSSRSTLYESVRQGGGATNLIDSLQSQLKQRDGEIFQLRVRRLCFVFILYPFSSLFIKSVSMLIPAGSPALNYFDMKL